MSKNAKKNVGMPAEDIKIKDFLDMIAPGIIKFNTDHFICGTKSEPEMSEDDYKKEFGDTPFGLLIRKIAKMEYDAAMQVFSGFINEQGLNQQQIVFVHKVVDY